MPLFSRRRRYQENPVWSLESQQRRRSECRMKITWLFTSQHQEMNAALYLILTTPPPLLSQMKAELESLNEHETLQPTPPLSVTEQQAWWKNLNAGLCPGEHLHHLSRPLHCHTTQSRVSFLFFFLNIMCSRSLFSPVTVVLLWRHVTSSCTG